MRRLKNWAAAAICKEESPMKRNFIAKRFQSAGTGLTLDTAALAKYCLLYTSDAADE